jgi:hypothetical protein
MVRDRIGVVRDRVGVALVGMVPRLFGLVRVCTGVVRDRIGAGPGPSGADPALVGTVPQLSGAGPVSFAQFTFRQHPTRRPLRHVVECSPGEPGRFAAWSNSFRNEFTVFWTP